MNLLSIPDVVEGNILPYLKWNDLLRFRRVCKAAKHIILAYIKAHPELTPEIEIGGDKNKSFGAFLKLNIPTNRIYLNNPSGHEFYTKDEKNISKFLKKCGPLVKHLRLKMFSLYPQGEEWNFMAKLVNLESFEIQYVGWEPFKRAELSRFDTNAFLEFVNKSEGLELGNDNIVDSQTAVAFTLICKCIREISNLKVFDFYSFHEGKFIEGAQIKPAASGGFLDLLNKCIKHGVQLKNVGSLWFYQSTYRPMFRSPDLGIPVLSLINLSSFILPLLMPNLERVEIREISKSSPGPQWKEQRPVWPALKSVDITSDCKRISGSVWENGNEIGVVHQDAKVIFQFFFQDIRRTNLSEIRLHFTKEAGQVAVPRTDDIVDSCPNLKKITLSKWPGTNKALVKLWDGLPALEEISLEYCKELGNVAFVGQDAKNPVFFKLKKLRKLSLKGLNQMPKITNTLFSLVLQHVSLTHLILKSDRPLKSVTSAGILCLLEGSFAEKIERFPFEHWSLEGVSVEEFKMMEVKFRSYNML